MIKKPILKCSDCGEEVTHCEYCGRGFDEEDECFCDSYRGEHFCSQECYCNNCGLGEGYIELDDEE